MQPRYVLVANDLIRNLREGNPAVGELIPGEMALCRQYGVSRITVRAALRELETRGLVSRHPGIGTRVEHAVPPAHTFVHLNQTVESVLQLAADFPYRQFATSLPVAEGALRDELKASDGEAFALSEGVRSRRGQKPICLTRLYLPREYGAALSHFRRFEGSASLILEEQFGLQLSRIRQLLTATRASADDAPRLKVEIDSPLLKSRRWYHDADGRLMFVAISLFPDGRYEHESVMMRRDPAARAVDEI